VGSLIDVIANLLLILALQKIKNRHTIRRDMNKSLCDGCFFNTAYILYSTLSWYKSHVYAF